MPLTRRRRRVPYRVELLPEESGLPEASFVMCDQLRTISTTRLLDRHPAGQVTSSTLDRVAEELLTILEFLNERT